MEIGCRATSAQVPIILDSNYLLEMQLEGTYLATADTVISKRVDVN